MNDLHDWTACGWLLSVMRAPVGTGIYSCTVRQYRQGEHAVLHGNATANNCTSPYSLDNSCATLAANGLHHSLYHLLEIVHGTSVDEVGSSVLRISFPSEASIAIFVFPHKLKLANAIRLFRISVWIASRR